MTFGPKLADQDPNNPQRTGYRDGGKARAAARASNQTKTWQRRYAEATTPAQRGAVDFDFVRSTLTKLAKTNPRAADQYWTQVSSTLHSIAEHALKTSDHNQCGPGRQR